MAGPSATVVFLYRQYREELALPARAALMSAKRHTLTHTFWLRQDFMVGIELPATLTCEEADRLAQYVLDIA